MRVALLCLALFATGVDARKKARHRKNYDDDGNSGMKMVEVDTFCGFDNCYDVLKLKRGVNKAAVKRAFRKLSRPVHADKDPSLEAKLAFRRFTQAKEVLSNDMKVAEYHNFLDNPAMYRYGSSMGASVSLRCARAALPFPLRVRCAALRSAPPAVRGGAARSVSSACMGGVSTPNEQRKRRRAARARGTRKALRYLLGALAGGEWSWCGRCGRRVGMKPVALALPCSAPTRPPLASGWNPIFYHRTRSMPALAQRPARHARLA